MSAMRGTGTLQPKNANPFSFIVFGDSQGETNSTTLKAIFKDMETVSPKPSFALSLGDIIHGEPSSTDNFTAQIERHLGDVLKLHKLAGIPVFNAPGNHEMDDWIAHEEKPSKRMRTAYETIVGSTYGSFNYGDSHFIILNTEDIPPVGMEGPSPEELKEGKEFSYIGEEQLAWLQSDLEANKETRHIIVAMHYPIYAHHPKRDNLFGESRTALINLFTKYPNISFVLASHEHQYYNSLDPENHDTVVPFKSGDPTQYLISGGAGASMKYFPLPGGFHHYLLFEVDGDNISVTIKRIL
jgi:3',5'-cyclic AMP phosphodiesterase CpdA